MQFASLGAVETRIWKVTGLFAAAMMVAIWAHATAGSPVTVKAADVVAIVKLADVQPTPGNKVGVTISFAVAPGWHIYGEGVSSDYIPTNVSVVSDAVASQNWNFPKPKVVHFEGLGDLPVYQGRFDAAGTVLIKPDAKPGPYQLDGTLKFQECNDTICKMPQTAQFALPLTVIAKK